jgi:hypothetical protein
MWTLVVPTFKNRPEDVVAVSEGRAFVGFLERGPLLLVTYAFSRDLMGALCFSWHLVPAAERRLPPVPSPGTSGPLRVVLAQGSMGSERLVVRHVTTRFLPPDAAQKWDAAIRRQADSAWDKVVWTCEEQKVMIHGASLVEEICPPTIELLPAVR